MLYLILVGCACLSVSAQKTQNLFPIDGKPIDVSPEQVPPSALGSGLGGIVRVLVTLDSGGNVRVVNDVSGPDWTCKQVTRPDVVALRSIAEQIAKSTRFENPEKLELQEWVAFRFPSGGSRKGEDFTAKGDVNFSVAPRAGEANAGSLRLSGGVLNGKADSLPRPRYPAAARAVKATGTVSVQVLIDEEGKIFSAQPVSGHPLLRPSSVLAACEATFSPTYLEGRPVKVSGVISYNFVP